MGLPGGIPANDDEVVIQGVLKDSLEKAAYISEKAELITGNPAGFLVNKLVMYTTRTFLRIHQR